MMKAATLLDEQTDKSPIKSLRRQGNSPYRRRGQRGWSLAQRRQQAEAIRRHRPWLKSTGPRSLAGKARCSGNALKDGMRSMLLRDIGRILRRQRLFVGQTLAAYRAGQAGSILLNAFLLHTQAGNLTQRTPP